jgi:uncharacterized membrane protein (DUF485 family)
MLPFRLARTAAEAEGLHLRLKARRVATRAILGLFALALFFAALCFLHVAVWLWLAERLAPRDVSFIFAGADIVLGLVLLLIAMLARAGRIEREARAIRRHALREMWSTLNLSLALMGLLDRIIRPRKPPDGSEERPAP